MYNDDDDDGNDDRNKAVVITGMLGSQCLAIVRFLVGILATSLVDPSDVMLQFASPASARRHRRDSPV